MAKKTENNLELWEKHSETPEEFLSEYWRGTKKLHNIDAHYQLRRATEEWGPYGRQWGISEIKIIELNAAEGLTVVMSGHFWYPDGQFQVVADMPFRADHDCFKSLLTMLRSKALSMLGFSADVYMGAFEDSHTPPQANTSAAAEHAISNAETHERLDQLAYLLQERAIEGAITQEEFEKLTRQLEARRKELSDE